MAKQHVINDLIISGKDILSGKLITELLAAGWTEAMIDDSYPRLS